jgi:hypothetical protein
MKKNTLGFFSLLFTLSLSAQEVVSTQGSSYSNASGAIDFTIGEVIINTGTSGSVSLTQGFHQTNWKFLGLTDFESSYMVSVFPNPTEEFLTIQTDNFEQVKYVLFDEQGKIVLQGNLTNPQTQLQVKQLANGIYTLSLSKEKLLLKTMKLVKTN